MNTRQIYILRVVLSFLLLAGGVFASPIPKKNAEKAACGWLNRNISPMGVGISRNVNEAEGVLNSQGSVLYYIVNLNPQGFIVLSADDEIEPVIVFSATGYYDSSQDSPLKDMLECDMQGRLEKISQKKTPSVRGKSEKADRWQGLVEAGSAVQSGGDFSFESSGVSSVTDIRVAPLLQSKWGQGDAYSGNCYNYYTPNHYPAGCVATAMAQIMRYHSRPTAGIGVHSFLIHIDGVEYYYNTRGGDGYGGAYNWSQMPYDPEMGLTTTQRQAIGALCYDAGVSVGMGYTAGSSGASTITASQAFVSTFGYSNSIFGDGFSSSGDAGLWGMMNANLDAALPVVLGISGPGVGHAIIADGYGYTSGTMYHHMNMGWAGLDDAWYQLPVIDVDVYYFNAITDCVYNIYPTGSGEIISGRVTNLAGAALDSVLVTAYQGTTVIKQAMTNSRGIYALKNIASSSQYRISAVKSGYAFTDQIISTGLSQNWNSASGNKCGIDFISTNALPPTAMNQTVDCNSTESKLITLEALDDHLPNPPGAITYIIASLPHHGKLSISGGGAITAVPYTLASNTVLYTPCQYFGGQDSFSFKANDGGTAPSGGESNIATVTVNVDNNLYSEFGTSGSSGNNMMINTTYYASRSQLLYLQADVGGAKYLTDLAIKFHTIPPIALKSWTIRLQHTNMSVYSDVPGNFLTTGWTKVYQADVTVSQTGWYNFHFSTPFHYNGTQNLLIDFSFNNTTISGSTGWYLFYNVGGSYDINRAITIVTSNATHTDPLTWDFWYGGGSYWGGDWMPSIKFTGTVPIDPIVGDFDLSCDVQFSDFAILAEAWMSRQGDSNYNSACDISTTKDNKVNMSDLYKFTQEWLEVYP